MFAMTACASPSAKLTKELEGARSWMATIEMVAGQWVENRVPSRYAARSLDEALTALHSANDALASATAKRDVAAVARTHITSAQQSIESLLSLIDANDRRAIPAAIAPLTGERQAMDSLIAASGSQ
jgi:hypothetical protein